MTIELTKSHLIQALADKSNKVIALSGRWGTGKSHLWAEVQKASSDAKVKAALYVSLFGVTSLDQVKVKIVQCALPAAAESPGLLDGAKKTWGAVLKGLEGLNRSFSALGALGELALLLTPAFLKNKVIVLDDIERKHDKLAVDELLGFIDEFTQRHGARFILILNTDRLEDKPIWETLREKVIDVELKLTTSPAEAFEIAIGLSPSRYANSIKKSVLVCGLTNIRIVQKVIRSVNRVLGEREDLSDSLLGRVISPTVLLSAIHYRGIADGPPIEYVLEVGSDKDWQTYHEQKENREEETDESKREGRWKSILSQLGISRCDEYEFLIVDFLESGLYEVEAVAKIINQYAQEEQTWVARSLANKLTQDFVWEHRLTEGQLLDRARDLVAHAAFIDPSKLTNVCEFVVELPGGQAIVDEMTALWVEGVSAKQTEFTDDDYQFHSKFHPTIQSALDAKRAQTQANLSLVEVCKYVTEQKAWGRRHRVVMLSSTVADFEQLIRNLPTSDLVNFLYQMLEFLTQKNVYGDDFGVAADRFAEACSKIVNAPDSGRLAKLIRRLFEDSKIPNLLIRPISA